MARETVTIEGLDDVVRRLTALGEAASKGGGPVRAAVRKASVVIQKEMKANIRRIVEEPNIGGQDYSTGTMEKSVKTMRAKANKSGLKGEMYIVTIPRRARYPISKRTPSGIAVATVAKMLEYGTAKMQPKKWARPAFHSKKDEALRVMTDEVLRGIDALERKLARS